jgi:hypothetical protein
MKSIVVYESFWGNTAMVGRAIAEGLGVSALPTSDATGGALEDADLIVAGAPVIAFSLPTNRMREDLKKNQRKASRPPDLSHPSLRSWLQALPEGRGLGAAFETRFAWSPGGSTGAILKGLERAGYRPVSEAQRFIVKGSYGPLRDGELEKARAWGEELSRVKP